MKLTLHQMVRKFHEAGGIPIQHRPRVPDKERVRLRLRLIAEEFFELLAACEIWPTYIVNDEVPGHEVNIAEFVKQCIDSDFASSDVVDLPKFADALADMDYINEGTRLEFGIWGESVLEEVHRANMAKFKTCGACEGRGTLSSPEGYDVPLCEICKGRGYLRHKREDGKVVKPLGWTPPNIEHVLLEQGWEPDA